MCSEPTLPVGSVVLCDPTDLLVDEDGVTVPLVGDLLGERDELERADECGSCSLL